MFSYWCLEQGNFNFSTLTWSPPETFTSLIRRTLQLMNLGLGQLKLRTLDSGINLALEFGKITNVSWSLIYSYDAHRKGNGYFFKKARKTTGRCPFCIWIKWKIRISNHEFAYWAGNRVPTKDFRAFGVATPNSKIAITLNLCRCLFYHFKNRKGN